MVEPTCLEDNSVFSKCANWCSSIGSGCLNSHLLNSLVTEERFVLLKSRRRCRFPLSHETGRSHRFPWIQRSWNTGMNASWCCLLGLFLAVFLLLHFIPHSLHHEVHVVRRRSFWVLRKSCDHILRRTVTFLRKRLNEEVDLLRANKKEFWAS